MATRRTITVTLTAAEFSSLIGALVDAESLDEDRCDEEGGYGASARREYIIRDRAFSKIKAAWYAKARRSAA